MNKLHLYGRVSTEPSLTYTPSGKARLFFVIGVRRPYKDQDGKPQYDNIPTVIIGRLAEVIAEFLKKSHYVVSSGSIETYTQGEGSNIKHGWNYRIDDINVLPNASKEPKEKETDFRDPFKDDGRQVDISSDDLPF